MARKSSSSSKPVPGFIVIAILAAIGYFVFNPGGGPQDQEAISDGSTQGEVPGAEAASLDEPAYDGPGYVLNFDESFSTGLSRVDDLGISVVIAVDTSGSMADPPAVGLGTPKSSQARAALLAILDYLENLSKADYMRGMKLRLGLLIFYEDVEVVQTMTDMDQAAFQNLRAILTNSQVLEPAGKTAIGLAMEKGTELLAQSGTILKSLLVITDGENTEGPEPETVQFAINNNRNTRSTKGWPVSTAGQLTSIVGFDIDTVFFEPLAKEGARIVGAADQAELLQALKDSLQADITLLESAGKN